MEADQSFSGESKEEHHHTPEPSAVASSSDEDDIYAVINPFPASQGQTEATINSEEKCSANPNSSMTTKELQEYWQNEKRSCREVKVLFEIPSARIVEKPFSKYVAYQIIILQTGSFDSDRSVIERRYSDFERLHASLLKDFRDEMEDVLFPKKSLTGNFTEDVILERKLAFRDYLRALYAMEYVRTSKAFIDFLVGAELEEAYGCLRGGQYSKALQVFLEVVALQEKLTRHRPVLLVPTLCAVVVCHKDLENARGAYEFGEKALARLEKHPGHRYCVPLLETMLSLAYSLGKDFLSFQERLDERKARKRRNKTATLKELAVLEYTR